MGPRKYFVSGLVLTATATTCPCYRADAGVLMTHAVAPDVPDGRTPPTATPLPRAAVRHGGASATADGSPDLGGPGRRLGVEANPPAAPGSGSAFFGGPAPAAHPRVVRAAEDLSPGKGFEQAGDATATATTAPLTDRRPANPPAPVNPAAQVMANPIAAPATSASPATATAAPVGSPVWSAVVGSAASSDRFATGDPAATTPGTTSTSSATPAAMAMPPASGTATPTTGIAGATAAGTSAPAPAAGAAPPPAPLTAGATTTQVGGPAAAITPPGNLATASGSLAPVGATLSALAGNGGVGTSLGATPATPVNPQAQTATMPTTLAATGVGPTAPGNSLVSGAMTQVVGMALMNQALGGPTVAGSPAVSSGPSATATSPAGTTSSATAAAGSVDLHGQKVDILSSASGLSPSTLVSSTGASASVTGLNPNLAPPALPLPAVDVVATDRAAATGGPAATPNTRVILPAPVPEPSGFLVFGLAAAAYAFRRRA